MKRILTILVVITLLVVTYGLWKKYNGIWVANSPTKENIVELIKTASQTPVPGENKTTMPLSVPDGYRISIYADGLVAPRDLELDPNGVLLTSVTSKGKVVALLDNKTETVLSGLNKPHGIAFANGKMYVAETNAVSTYDYDSNTRKATNKNKIIDLPGGGGHFTRSILIKDSKIYVSIGSTCNVCVEYDSKRASIWYANLDGSDFKLFSSGLRNSVFMAVNPKTNQIWATNMGRDNLGDDVPPETVNVIKEGANYGWPYCYGNKVPDKETNPQNSKFDCNKMEAPELMFQAHTAPLGIAFLDNNVLVALHGSWNRTIPAGYKIIKFVSGKEEDFITGWQRNDNEIIGRPVDILVKGTEIYISDDKAGVVYKLQKI